MRILLRVTPTHVARASKTCQWRRSLLKEAESRRIEWEKDRETASWLQYRKYRRIHRKIAMFHVLAANILIALGDLTSNPLLQPLNLDTLDLNLEYSGRIDDDM